MDQNEAPVLSLLAKKNAIICKTTELGGAELLVGFSSTTYIPLITFTSNHNPRTM